jgi:hypothetical protein
MVSLEKRKRKMRIPKRRQPNKQRNPVARALRDPRYHARVVKDKTTYSRKKKDFQNV